MSELSTGAGSTSTGSLIGAALDGLRRADSLTRNFSRYQTDPAGYSRDILNLQPWAGEGGEPGQLELFDAIGESVRKQLAGDPDHVRWFRVPAGHGVGKTFGAAQLVNWFYDSFAPSIIYTTAPTGRQVKALLWKDIKAQRPKSLPGQPLPKAPEMWKGPNHFAVGFTTDNGEEGFQGQHGPHLFFVLDEAEGVPDWVFGSVRAMMTGGLVICLMLANPRTRSSRFHRLGMKSDADGKGKIQTFRLDALCHPNVVHGRDVVPHACSRASVDDYIDELCDVVARHDPDEYTFEVPWRPGVILQPKPGGEFLWRVRGIAPPNSTTNTLIPVGRFEAACERPPMDEDKTFARIGLDCARFGDDSGTGYVRHAGQVRRFGRWSGEDSRVYVADTKREADRLRKLGVESLHVRVDGGGGYGSGQIDGLNADPDLRRWFRDFQVLEVHNNAEPHDEEQYADLVTEMYAHAGESLKGLRVDRPPPELCDDLTERRYDYANKKGRMVKRLEEKKAFKKRILRSPDEGDGLVLAVAPDFLFNSAGTVLKGMTKL